MDISLFLAQVFGLYFIFAGVTILIRPTAVTELMEAFSNRGHLFIAGFMSLIIGIPLVLLHNIWDGTWRVIITVLVWLTLFKGISLIYVPDTVSGWMAVFSKHANLTRHSVWILIIFGIYLMSLGFSWSM